MMEFEFKELLDSYHPATDAQIRELGRTELSCALDGKLLWLDDGVTVGEHERIAPNQLGVILYDDKGAPVNLLGVSDGKTANDHAGAVMMGDKNAHSAYLVAGIEDAVELWTHLDAKTAGKNEPFLIIACMPYHLAQIARAYQWQKNLIIPINASQKDEILARLAGVKCQIHAHTAPAQDIYNDITPLEIIRQDGKFFYMGGEFVIKDGALYYEKTDEDENTKSTLICGALYVDGRTRDKDSNNWGRLLRFYDDDERLHLWAMPTALLHGDGREYRKELAGMGLMISTSATAKRLLDAYLQYHPNTVKILSVDSVGWHDMGETWAYALPNRIWGENIALQAQGAHGYGEKGTLQSWQQNVALPIERQHRLNFALCVGLAGTVLTPLGFDGMGFHFVGSSSMGKSLALKIASSLWGAPKDFMRTWRATANGLESVAKLHHDNFLALDELGQANGKQLGEIVYMLADGQGASRMNKELQARDNKKWRNTILSTGEVTIKQMLQEVGQQIKAGQEIRLAHIRADAGAGMGMFNEKPPISPQEQASALEQAVQKHYGKAGVFWLDYLTQHTDKAKTAILATMGEFLTSYELSAQQNRVAKRFAIVAGVGELASKIGLTGWQKGSAYTACKACFDDWLAHYGNDELELVGLIERINDMIDRHEFSRFIKLDRNTVKSDIAHIHNLLGYIVTIGDDELYCFNNAGFKETIGNLDKKDCLIFLKSNNLLKVSDGNKYKLQHPAIKTQRFYAILEKIREFGME